MTTTLQTLESSNLPETARRQRTLALWPLRAFFSMAALYLFYYFGKKNIGPAAMAIEEAFAFSHSQLGWALTAFTLTYALGQFINGFLGDRYSPKRVMLIGAFGSVVANVLFGFSNGLTLFILFWAVNGYFSSMGWAPGCRILCNWFPENRWGWWMGVYNFFPYLGGALVSPIAAWSVARYGWRAAFVVPPMFLFGMALLFVRLGKSAPEAASHSAAVSRPRVGPAEYRRAFTHPQMILPYAVAFGANAIRWGLLHWSILVLETPADKGGFGLTLTKAGLIGSLVDWGGMFFAIALGVLSDRVFAGRRRQTIALSLTVTAAALGFLSLGAPILGLPMGMLWLGVAMFIAGGLIQGMHTPLFCLPGDLLGQSLSGTGAGIMDGWMYIGAALAGFPLGWWLDTYGLTSGLALLGVVSLLFGLLALGIRR